MRLRSLLVVVLVAAGAAVPAADGRVRPQASPTRLEALVAGPSPVATPFPLSHVGVRWLGSEDALVEVRTGIPGSLGPWRPVAVAHDLGDEERGIRLSGLLRADGATVVQARARGAARKVEIVVIDAASGLRSSEATAATHERVDVVGGSAGPAQPEAVPRAAWGADEGMRTGTPEFARPAKLIVHHTVTPNDDPDPASTVRAIYAYHTRQNGWNDIGYNFLVDADGRIYEGRYARAYGPGETPTGEDTEGRGVTGAHARGFNPGSVGVALLGDFSGGAQPTGAAIDSLVRLLAWKAHRHGIDPHGAGAYTRSDGSQVAFPNLAGHRDVGQTACPGDRLYERLPEVRDRVAATMMIPAPPTPLPPTPPAPPIPGFWTVTGDGRVQAHGDAPTAGDLAGAPLAAPVVAMATTPAGDGYWLAAADGGVFAFGDAPFLGAATGALSAPAVQLEPTPSGRGYWIVSSSGQVVPFGDATFLGATAPPSLGGEAPAAPQAVEIAGLATTPSGHGYWLAATDGRVFAFGDALPRGATPGQAVTGAVGAVKPAAPIVSIAAHPDGRGYWLLGADGGVFAVDTGFFGSLAGRKPPPEAVQLRVTRTGDGYYVAAGDGAVYAFGDADRRRELPGGDRGVVDLALRNVKTP
ncbi:MAG: peptidoglycan recognition protein [Actinomycetota bacterium]|nr:peptidoglycan recognition protein [Actinomycetota bacterium]